MKQLPRLALLALALLLAAPKDAPAQAQKLSDEVRWEYRDFTLGAGESRVRHYQKREKRTARSLVKGKTVYGKVTFGPWTTYKQLGDPEQVGRPDWARAYYADAKEPKETYDQDGQRYGIYNRTWFDYRLEGGKWTRFVRSREEVRKLVGDAPPPPPPPPPPDGDPPPAQGLRAGDEVWAEWKANDWYRGKIAKVDGKDYSIAFDDGDSSIVDAPKIAPDRTPRKDDLAVDTRVLAKFQKGRFYPGTITSIDDGTYSIKFDDGDTDQVSIQDLRLIAK